MEIAPLHTFLPTAMGFFILPRMPGDDSPLDSLDLDVLADPASDAGPLALLPPRSRPLSPPSWIIFLMSCFMCVAN
eukprot:1345108-Pyramimonas_sp.AAC.2